VKDFEMTEVPSIEFIGYRTPQHEQNNYSVIPDDDRIVSHDAILYLHEATSKFSWIQREKTWFSPRSISCFYRSKREEKCIV